MVYRILLVVLLACPMVRAGSVSLRAGEAIPPELRQQVTTMLRDGAKLELVDPGKPADVLALLDPVDQGVRLRTVTVRDGVLTHDKAYPLSGREAALAIATQIEASVRGLANATPLGMTPTFVGRDLTHEFDHLRAALSAAAREALLEQGAVVALEESALLGAQAVLRPDATRPAIERRVPILVTGEYRTQRLDGALRVTIRVLVYSGDKTLLDTTLAPVPLHESAGAVRTFVKTQVVPLLEQAKPLGTKRQGELLSRQADALTETGAFRDAAMLREALLLLDPNADAERYKLVGNYSRSNARPVPDGAWPAGARDHLTDPFWRGVVLRTIDDWHRALVHCEFLIKNQRLSREEATLAAHSALHSIVGVRGTASEMLGECETTKKRFLREVFSLVPSLPPASREVRSKLSGMLDPYGAISDMVRMRCDGNFYLKEDLDLVVDLWTRRLPESAPPNYNLVFMLQGGATGVLKSSDQQGWSKVSEKEFAGFLEALSKSDRPLPRIYARHARIYQQRYGHQQPATQEMLAEAKSIVADAAKVGFDLQQYDYFMGQLRDQASRLEHELRPKAPEPRVANNRPKPRTKPEPAKANRVTLEPIAIENLDKSWRAAGGMSGIYHCRSLGDGLEAYWGAGAVLLMRERDQAKEVFANEKSSVSDVVSDGKYVYIATLYGNGIEVLSREGKPLLTVNENFGLPMASRFGMFLHPIEPGKVLAVSTTGEEYRAWVAVVTFDGKSAKVELIHEASKTRDHGATGIESLLDPALCFRPEVLVGHTTPDGRRLVYIPRPGAPLVVDLKTNKVSVYPEHDFKPGAFPRRDPPAEAFMSIDGVLWVAGSERDVRAYKMKDQTSALLAIREPATWHSGNATSGTLARHGDWLYYSGDYVWKRISLKSNADELIVEDPRQLPDYGSGRGWTLMNSAHYGLVAFRAGKLYRVMLDGKPVE